MKIKYIMSMMLVVAMFGCNNQPFEFDDYKYTTCFFPFQTPARTLILGDYDQGINEKDNNHMFEIGVTMSGVYSNEQNRKVHFEVDNAMLGGVANVQALPQSYYSIETPNPVIIPSGSMKGRISVQLTDAFFDDPLSFGDPNSTNYVIPVVITQVEGIDSVLAGRSLVGNPDRLDPADWDVMPKDYTLYGIKFMNRFHGHYLRRGRDVLTDATGNTVDNIYHTEYVEKGEVIMVTTSGKNEVMLKTRVRRGSEDSPGDVNMELSFNDGDNCTIASAEGDPYNVSGSGTFKTDGDMWGNKPRDVIYLDYSYTDGVNNETHAVKDTLVVRDRAAIFEEFQVELN